ncbi:MAG: hypothetical protein M3N26_04600 [Pseudomonadota bacterium]|nr:hypothetical protein [Pseudomonadota bacterium]
MEHYLVFLSYNAAGWRHIAAASAGFDERLDPVRKLLEQLGGSFATFQFGAAAPAAGRPAAAGHEVRDKFAMFDTHDLMAVIAVPDKVAAQAFRLAVASQDGVASVKLTALLPFEHAVTSAVKASADAVKSSRYAGPGGTVHRP